MTKSKEPVRVLVDVTKTYGMMCLCEEYIWFNPGEFTCGCGRKWKLEIKAEAVEVKNA